MEYHIELETSIDEENDTTMCDNSMPSAINEARPTDYQIALDAEVVEKVDVIMEDRPANKTRYRQKGNSLGKKVLKSSTTHRDASKPDFTSASSHIGAHRTLHTTNRRKARHMPYPLVAERKVMRPFPQPPDLMDYDSRDQFSSETQHQHTTNTQNETPDLLPSRDLNIIRPALLEHQLGISDGPTVSQQDEPVHDIQVEEEDAVSIVSEADELHKNADIGGNNPVWKEQDVPNGADELHKNADNGGNDSILTKRIAARLKDWVSPELFKKRQYDPDGDKDNREHEIRATKTVRPIKRLRSRGNLNPNARYDDDAAAQFVDVPLGPGPETGPSASSFPALPASGGSASRPPLPITLPEEEEEEEEL